MLDDFLIAKRQITKYFSLAVGSDPDCGPKIIEQISGSVTSPLYPYSYKSNAECIQTIKTPVGSRVKLDFQDMDIEQLDGECHYDFLHVGAAVFIYRDLSS